jgi:hypothetical protein
VAAIWELASLTSVIRVFGEGRTVKTCRPQWPPCDGDESKVSADQETELRVAVMADAPKFSCERPDYGTNQFLAKRDFLGSALREKQPFLLMYRTTSFAVNQSTIVEAARICPFPAVQMGKPTYSRLH